MKLVSLAVALLVALLTGATIWVGARVREPTVVAHPYEEGLAYDRQRHALAAAGPPDHHAGAAAAAPAPACDLGAGPCAAALEGMELTLELAPRPLAALRELAVEARLRAGGSPVDGAELEVSFAMKDMHMGENRVRLAPAGPGRYRGAAVLVRCLSGRRDWRATVTARHGGRERRAELALTLAE